MTQKHSDRMRRLAASDLLPERAGQPVKAWVHLSPGRGNPVWPNDPNWANSANLRAIRYLARDVSG
jgi:hypothetical protein